MNGARWFSQMQAMNALVYYGDGTCAPLSMPLQAKALASNSSIFEESEKTFHETDVCRRSIRLTM